MGVMRSETPYFRTVLAGMDDKYRHPRASVAVWAHAMCCQSRHKVLGGRSSFRNVLI